MTYRFTKRDVLVPVLLVALSVIPTAGAVVRLMSVAGNTAPAADNARFLQAPLPVVVHALSATLYCLLGAFQFTRGFRIRWPRWHRQAGKVLALAGLTTGLSGLWMTMFYAIPLSLQGPYLYWVRLAVGSAMVVSIAIAWQSILRRNVARHEAFMIRAYALGQGAGTQALIMLPWMLTTGQSGGPTRDLLMTLAWLINIVVAESIIRWRERPYKAAPASLETAGIASRH